MKAYISRLWEPDKVCCRNFGYIAYLAGVYWYQAQLREDLSYKDIVPENAVLRCRSDNGQLIAAERTSRSKVVK